MWAKHPHSWNKINLLILNVIYCCTWKCERGCPCATASLWRSEDNFQKSDSLSFVGLGHTLGASGLQALSPEEPPQPQRLLFFLTTSKPRQPFCFVSLRQGLAKYPWLSWTHYVDQACLGLLGAGIKVCVIQRLPVVPVLTQHSHCPLHAQQRVPWPSLTGVLGRL